MNNRSLRAALLGALLLASSCSTSDRRDPRAGRTAEPPAPDTIHANVTHRDAQGVPSFVWVTRTRVDEQRFATAREAATTTLAGLAGPLGLSRAALAATTLTYVDDPSSLGGPASSRTWGREWGPVLARFDQRVNGVEVFHGSLTLTLTRDHEPVAASGALAPSLEGAARPFTIEPRAAVEAAHVAAVGALPSLTAAGGDGVYTRYDAPHFAWPARVKKVYFRRSAALVEPAYYVETALKAGPVVAHVVSATDGGILLSADLVHHDAYTYRAWASPTTLLPMDGPQGNGALPHPTGKPDGFKPTFVPMELVTLANFPFSKNDPWLPPNATTTDGNNVSAYADLQTPDGYDAAFGDVRSTAAGGVFDHVYDTASSPAVTNESIQGAVTQLFYLTNFMHDWFYDAGFDEKSGNHQSNNFGRGGRDRDPLLAEAQDYSGKNNANAAVPADGQSPRLQMFVFSGPSDASLTVNAPAPLAGVKSAGIGGFGQTEFDLVGDVVVADDATGTDVADGCEPLVNNVAGKIVLVHRGLCSFIQKALNVQAAGGVGAIVTNIASSTQPSLPPFMGGTDNPANPVTIPVLSVAFGDGAALEGAAGVNVTLHRAAQLDLDGALDTTISAHEWGHVMNGRLIGDGTGLLTSQAGGLGEGWADFTALLVVARADDPTTPQGANWTGSYQNGAYSAIGSGGDIYFGLRRVPYSVDFKKNPLTFKHIQNGSPLPTDVPISFGEDGSFNSEVHNTGEIWATMLWECYVALLRKAGVTFDEAQLRMKRYLVASMKLTPINPTLMEARDAVLAAAAAADKDDYLLFWQAFARRGAGVGAVGPTKDAPGNAGVKESFAVGNDVEVVYAKVSDDAITCDHDGILDDGETGTIEIGLRNSGSGRLTQTAVELSAKSPGITFPDGPKLTVNALEPFEKTVVKARAFVTASAKPEPVDVDVVVTDPTLAVPRVIRVSVASRTNADEAPDSSASDSIDTQNTAWKVAGSDTFGTTKKWDRKYEGHDGWWFVPNGAEASEHTLASPKFTITGTNFTLTFKHRYSFRGSTRRMLDLDGGVVEVSTDGGKSWRDASEFGKVDYNTTLDQTRNDNELAGRKAYGNRSAGYPDNWIQSRLDLSLKSHPETVMVRFHVGTGTSRIGSGAPGWEINDIALEGISSTPFWSFVPHADQCDPNGPTADAGPPRTVQARSSVTILGSGSHPAGQPLTYVWTQVGGPPQRIRTDGTPALAFEAPDTNEPVDLAFQLRVHDGKLLSPASRVQVTVTPEGGEIGGAGCACRTSRASAPDLGSLAGSFALGGVVLFALRRRRRVA